MLDFSKYQSSISTTAKIEYRIDNFQLNFISLAYFIMLLFSKLLGSLFFDKLNIGKNKYFKMHH